MPDRSAEVQRIRSVYGPIADKMISEQTPFMDLSPEAFALLKQHILDHWDDIQAVAAEVPEAQWFSDRMRQAGGAAKPGDLGLSDEEVQQALLNSHLLRNRFTICKLGRLLTLMDGM